MTGRIADLSLSQNAIQYLQASLSQVADLQNQASTGKKLTKPSDSPVDIGTSLQLRASLNRNTQLASNISDAEGWLGTTDSTLGQVVTQLQQVNSLVIQAANAGASDQTSRDAIANQIDQIRQSLIGARQHAVRQPAALRRHRPRAATAYDASGNYVGHVGARCSASIAPGVQVQVNVNGDAVFGPPGNDLFTTLAQTLRRDSRRPAADRAERAAEHADPAGRRPRRRRSARPTRASTPPRTRTRRMRRTMKQNLSNVEDADMAQVLMNLQAQETTYQAALAAAAKAIQPSLAAFLQ